MGSITRSIGLALSANFMVIETVEEHCRAGNGEIGNRTAYIGLLCRI